MKLSLEDLISPRDKYGQELVKAFLSQEKVNFIRASPGTGKTYAAVAFSLWRALNNDRIAIFMRTRNEINHALEISNRLSRSLLSRNINPPLIVPVGGKETLCRFPPENPAIIKWWCQIIRCEYISRRRSSRLRQLILEQRPSNLREYFILAREENVCPYFAYQELCASSPIVLATHPYFIRDEFYERIGNRDILIVDEAHNLLKIITGRIKIQAFEEAKRILKHLGENIPSNIRRLWSLNQKEEAIVLSQYESYLESTGFQVRVGEEFLKIQTPLNLLKRRLLSARQIFLISSTLYPSGLYKTLFSQKIPSRTHIIPGLFKNTEKRYIAVLKIGLSSKIEYRTKRSYQKYAKTIEMIINQINKPTIIVTPSYNFAEELSELLDLDIVRDDSNILDNVIITVARGRLAEGVDVKIGERVPEILVIAGLPYPERNEEILKIIRFYSKYYDIKFSKLLKMIETSEMISGLLQAAGRVGRQKKGAVVIIDDRLPLLGLKIPVYTTLGSLIKALKNFFNEPS